MSHSIMKSTLSKSILAVALAASLGACADLSASLAGPEPTVKTVDRVHEGLTRDDVRSLVGKPEYTGTAPSGDAVWTYQFTDLWGSTSEFYVTFDTSGRVAHTGRLRLGE